MTASRPVNVYETYNRSIKGTKMAEKDWDYKVIPENASKMKEKYGIKFGREMIPTDKNLMRDLYLAGMEMLVTSGMYNADTGRVISITEEEVKEGIKRTPKRLQIGEHRDAAISPLGGVTPQRNRSYKVDRPVLPYLRIYSSR